MPKCLEWAFESPIRRALRELTYLEITGPTKVERRIECVEDYETVLRSLIDFDLGDDLVRLYSLVRDRVARHRATETAAAEAEA